ncbi:MAG: 16S rRNA (guanine(527)-N(7))-methyltransferase RsmG [Lactobacillales bacterium]|nr:16S rRNA (guanine(527)-N(7))-methyltransferase RsmG [Lactobacillales bacterium]
MKMNQNKFIEELKKINIELTDKQLNDLEIYYEMLVEYNERMNLTGITEKDQVYLKHFYDSLTIIKIIDLKNEETLCDIGTGAGFPGMVLKIVFPNLKITLVDSLNKRIEFLKDVKEKLKLENLEIIHARAEEFARINIEKFDVVTARAVAHLSILLEYSIPMVKINKYFIAMKGNINEELEESKNAIKLLNSELEEVIEFKLPIEESTRNLVKITKISKTNTKYPRKYSEIKKKKL